MQWQQCLLLHQTKSMLCTSTTTYTTDLVTKPYKFINIQGEGQTTKVTIKFIRIHRFKNACSR